MANEPNQQQRSRRGELSAPKSKIPEQLKKLWEKKRTAFWWLVVVVSVLWLWPMGGWGTLSCWSGIAECAATWTDEWGTHVRRPVNIGGPPVRMIEVAKEDIIEVSCSGSSSILTTFQAGTRRIKSGCYGLEFTPSQMSREDPSQWPMPNVPVLAAICRAVPYGDPFRQERQWLERQWARISYRGGRQWLKGGGDTHDSLYINVDGYLYCWVNAPLDNRGRPEGTYWFEVEN